MTDHQYRFAVIPAGAITDRRLTPRALQMLCMLGRHTNNNGWCRIRQTRLATELGCARSTVQAALDLLRDTGWVEVRLGGRPGAATPDPEGQPYASHHYRVVLDRDQASAILAEPEVGADAVAAAPDDANLDAAAGAAASGVPDQPAPPSTEAGGVPDTPAPRADAMGSAPNKGPFNNSTTPQSPPCGEAAGLPRGGTTGPPEDVEAQFSAIYPVPCNDPARLREALRNVPIGEQDALLTGARGVAAYKAGNPKAPLPGPIKFVERQLWPSYARYAPRPRGAPAEQGAPLVEFFVAHGSDDWRALEFLERVSGRRAGLRVTDIAGHGRGVMRRVAPTRGLAVLAPLLDFVGPWLPVDLNTPQWHAWRERLGECGFAMPDVRRLKTIVEPLKDGDRIVRLGQYRQGAFFPTSWPPPKGDGEEARAPPIAPLTAADVAEFSGGL